MLPISLPITGMMMSLTSESTIFPKAPPMMTPTAKSSTLPLMAKSRNSCIMPMKMSSGFATGLK
jgi:hypothetical protein